MHTDGESEAPPSHIEGEGSATIDRGDRKEEPEEAKPPHEEGADEAEDVEYFACIGYEREGPRLWKYRVGILAEE